MKLRLDPLTAMIAIILIPSLLHMATVSGDKEDETEASFCFFCWDVKSANKVTEATE